MIPNIASRRVTTGLKERLEVSYVKFSKELDQKSHRVIACT